MPYAPSSAAVAAVFGAAENDNAGAFYLNVDPTTAETTNDWMMMHLSENTSHQCAASAWEKLCCLAYCSDNEYQHSTEDKPLWWLVLRWMNRMLFKIIRSYHAKPLLLIMAPLVVGLLVGYWMGQRQSSSCSNSKRLDNHSAPSMRQRIVAMTSVLLPVVNSVRYYFITLLWNIIPRHKNDEDATIPYDKNSQHSNNCCTTTNPVSKTTSLRQREENVRTNLKSDDGTAQESGIPASQVPKHVAVIMDGNRRYGKAKYGNGSRGHWDGSSKLVEFAKWCLAEKVAVLTVFAFSSENWNRDPAEVASLMQIFAKYCDELREEAIQRNIKIVVLSTDQGKIPPRVQKGVKRMVEETQHCDAMIMNICLSYGSRGEMVQATKSVVNDVLYNNLDPSKIDEDTLHRRLLTHSSGGDPDVLIRTSGEVRISNFLLWQLAYTELFFVDKPWPAMDKEDLLKVIRAYANGRNRRFGK